jgi:cytochrome c oxidase assembly factor CtaG
MTTWQLLTTTWNWEPSVIVGCIALAGAYFLALRLSGAWPPAIGKVALFLLGDLMILLALVSPLDFLGDGYLFSAHMLQHVLLLLAAVPLIAALPAAMVPRALGAPATSRALCMLGYPVTPWLVGVLTVWAWHLPVLYNAALADENVHLAEHLCFLASACVFWWPVLAPGETARLTPKRATFYVLGGMAANSLLSIVLIFGPVGWYPIYLHPADPFGALALVRDSWGLTPADDQSMAGLVMLALPGGLVYTPAMFAAFERWLDGSAMAGDPPGVAGDLPR